MRNASAQPARYLRNARLIQRIISAQSRSQYVLSLTQQRKRPCHLFPTCA
ncbi:hypothetical protein HMPREF3190_01560 [Umbribacter vaginalis]|nr:hypothetical protein HMPREF3190_01560 [Coriobacteriales bacterium DNF00809]